MSFNRGQPDELVVLVELDAKPAMDAVLRDEFLERSSRKLYGLTVGGPCAHCPGLAAIVGEQVIGPDMEGDD